MTVEDWAREYILTTDLAFKLAPPPPPDAWADGPAERVVAPGRPDVFTIEERAHKARGLNAPSGRARALHTFLHHELQAAELMAWALLAYPDAPRAFRQGLVRILQDEARHMRMYAEHIERLGYEVGAFPVRDWFWLRVPACADPASFVATMGLGFESANLEHTARFAARFRSAGDEEGARVQEVVGREEIAHVRFGVKWFLHFRQELGFDDWSRALPAPLSPLFMRGSPLQRDARRQAGQTDAFLDALAAWNPDEAPCPSPGS